MRQCESAVSGASTAASRSRGGVAADPLSPGAFRVVPAHLRPCLQRVRDRSSMSLDPASVPVPADRLGGDHPLAQVQRQDVVVLFRVPATKESERGPERQAGRLCRKDTNSGASS